LEGIGSKVGMRPFSQDLRERIIAGRKENRSAGELSQRFGVCKRTVERYWERYQKEGEASTRKIGGHRLAKLRAHDALLRRWIAQKASITLAELARKCREELGIAVVPQTIWNRQRKLGLSHKKKSAGSRTKSAQRPSRP